MTDSARWLWLEQEWHEPLWLSPSRDPELVTCQDVSRVSEQPLFGRHAASVGLKLPTHGSAALAWLL